MNFIDLKYVNLLSGRLERFAVKNTRPYRVNFRCPICGDSQKSKSKCRGWFLEQNHDLTVYYCHNCNASMSLGNFIKFLDTSLFNEYSADRWFESDKNRDELPLTQAMEFNTPAYKKQGSPLLSIKKISSLRHDHPAKKYIEKRLIPASNHYKLYYAPKFVAWVNSLIPDKLDMKEHPRLILPFIDKNGEVFGFQGRAFDKSELRYITIMLDESRHKIFGLDNVDFTKTYYIVEGPIDSLFLKNSIAMAGSDLNVSDLKNKDKAVVIYDNEPRSKQIVSKMSKAIEDGFKVFFWPNVKGKDVNEVILNGLTIDSFSRIINDSSYSGLMASTYLNSWRKC